MSAICNQQSTLVVCTASAQASAQTLAPASCAPTPPSAGWHLDETPDTYIRDVIHRMGRRCGRWDYCGTGAYLITMALADRSRPWFGRLVGNSPETAAVELSPLGA